MRKLLLLLTASSMLGACSYTSKECGYIGCETGQLQFYPNEELGAQRQARDFYNFEWGETSSAYPPSDPKHWELKRQEIEAGNTAYHWNK